MNLLSAINNRSSRRTYLSTPIDENALAQLTAMLRKFNEEADVDMRLVLDNSDGWNGLGNSYGMFSGVSNYVGLIHKGGDFQALERMGYYGELWVLNAVALGLGSCWVAGSYKRQLCPFELDEDEEVACSIAFGNVAQSPGGKEKLIRRLTHLKTNSMADMMQAEGDAPYWFIDGMRAVQKAPSAANRQPVTFTYSEGVTAAAIPDYKQSSMLLDFGIAKLHFEIGAYGSKQEQCMWEWGNGGEFHYRLD